MTLLRSLLPGLLALLPLGAQTTLVQSIPVETDLAHPALPFAKDVWLDLIRGAKTRIDVAQFYVFNRPGSALEPVLQALEAAGRRGVKLRVLLSDKMLPNDPASVARLKAIPGLELRIYDLRGTSEGVLHAKCFLVDGREAFLGSQNLDYRALEHIHELGLRTTDPALVGPLARVFEADWAFALDRSRPARAGEAATPSVPPAVELVASPPFLNPPGIRAAEGVLADLLGEAQGTLRIQLLTYSPVRGRRYWPLVDQALRAAAARGVKVQFLVSDWVLKSKGLAHLKSLSLVPGIEVRIASIPEARSGYLPFARVIHSKYLLVDDRTLWLGTSNWEENYFRAARNVEAVLREPRLAAQAAEVFQKLWSSPYAQPIEPLKAYVPRKVD